MTKDQADVIKATANAVLALYGLPEPYIGDTLEEVAARLNSVASQLRTSGRHPTINSYTTR